MGDLPFDSETSMNQRLMQLERRLKEQQDSHQQQLASFMAANASLLEENAALRNVVSALPRLNGIAHRMDAPTGNRNLVQSESMENFSLDANHDSMGGSRRGTNTFTQEEPGPRITSDVRWAVGPLKPPNALWADHNSPDGKRCPFVQGIHVQLSRSNPVVVPSPGPKLSNVLSLVVREIRFPIYMLRGAKIEC